MTLTINGNSHTTTSHYLGELMAEINQAHGEGIAVAINQEVVAFDQWEQTPLQENDQILIITATQGG